VRTLLRRAPGALIAAALTLLAGCAAERLHRDGLTAIDHGDYELGVADLSQALARDPNNIAYRLDYQTRRESSVRSLVAQADAARSAGQLEAASALFRRTLAIDPSNDRARHGLEAIAADQRHAAALVGARQAFDRHDFDDAEAQLRRILSEDPGFVPAQQLLASVNQARGPQNIAPRLQGRENKKVTLQLRDAPTKMVFEVLQRESGINFILDKDVKSDTKTSLFVQDVPVEAAIDLVLEQNQLAREILSSNMVLIYPNTAAKQKEYEQQIVRAFYLTNAAPKDVESAFKTVLNAKTLFIDEQANMVVIRDTPDMVGMAEKLVTSMDIAEPEVMLELEVLEISHSRVQDLGIQYPGAVTFTPQSVSTGAATAGTAGLVLSDLSHQNSNTIGISSISATVNAMKQAGVVNTLASPRIRARNKEKAKVLIGSREPVITNSVTPTAAGAPVVTGSVQYLDVGLTLDVQPTVYLDGDVAVKIGLEVSTILKQVATASGTIAYEIGTRNANTLLRLKDGETQILAGLIQDSDTKNFNSVPGLGDIPILGKLFGSTHTDREKSEVVLSVTPRIIRMQPRPPSDATEFWYGNESRTRTRPYSAEMGAPAAGAAPAPRTAPAGSASAPPATPGVAPVQPSGAPQPIAPSVPADTVSAPLSGPVELPGTGGGSAVPENKSAAASQGVPSAPPAPIVAASTPAAAGGEGSAGGGAAAGSKAGGAPSALTVEGPSEAKIGDEFDVRVQLSTQDPITHLRAQLRYDSSALQIVDASVGEVVPPGAGSPTVNTKGVGAQLDVTTPPEDPVLGSGTLMTVRFKALATRPSSNIAAMVNVLGGSGSATGNASAQPLVVNIHQ
jgi:general secretion pathway protein D